MVHQYNRVRGLVVMIVACQVMDPGSIPGERSFFFLPFFVFAFAPLADMVGSSVF